MNIKTGGITLSDVMEKRIHKVFVRESGPDAWGGGVNVKKGSLVRRGRHNDDWFLAKRICCSGWNMRIPIWKSIPPERACLTFMKHTGTEGGRI